MHLWPEGTALLQTLKSRAADTASAPLRTKLPNLLITGRQVSAHVGDVELLLLALFAGCVTHVACELQLDLAAWKRIR